MAAAAQKALLPFGTPSFPVSGTAPYTAKGDPPLLVERQSQDGVSVLTPCLYCLTQSQPLPTSWAPRSQHQGLPSSHIRAEQGHLSACGFYSQALPPFTLYLPTLQTVCKHLRTLGPTSAYIAHGFQSVSFCPSGKGWEGPSSLANETIRFTLLAYIHLTPLVISDTRIQHSPKHHSAKSQMLKKKKKYCNFDIRESHQLISRVDAASQLR